METKDYYEILKLKKSCNSKQIKTSFIKLAKKHYPQNNKEKKLELSFVEIAEAYEILIDKEKRHIYDSYGLKGLYGEGFENYKTLSFNEAISILKGLTDNSSQKSFLDFQNKYYETSESFNFNGLNWKVDGIIFVTAGLFVPLFFSIIAVTLFGLKTNPSAQVVIQFVQIISVMLGFIVLFQKHRSIYLKQGYAWEFFYFVLPIVFILIASLLSALENNIKVMMLELIPKLILAIFIIVYDKRLVKKIKETFKNHLGSLVVTVIIGTIVMVGVSLFLTEIVETRLFKLGDSNNQNALIGVLNDPNAAKSTKIGYAILLMAYAVIVAPFVEEVVFRYCWFLNSSNKWFGLITSAIVFGFIHYGITGDYEHLLSYTWGGAVLGGVFVFTKGNTTHTWLMHFLNNLYSAITIFAFASW
ncbi:CAAX amino terminal membrane bound protease [Spiroplasma helicoides]|uniref:CAAX amino terminal membrane bound protease n=1 Tax=Spiroplasma helicoides TaxID=216938 RepID=A0A1B3SJH6_9MOLU|nr:DnaJ domain-containing protein [Spiroplasma helicoides]AOG60070.1 CAAX amino terminal membrane bound protease [Spiroplasma helicoides]